MSQKGNKKYIRNNHNCKKLDGDHYLLTTEHGSWIVLSREDYRKFRRGEIGGKLEERLKRSELLLTEENVQDVVKKYAVKNHFLFTGPSLHIITPTMRCNQRCTYCHSEAVGIDESGYDLDEETAKGIVDFAFETNSSSLKFEFQGGEPLLNISAVENVINYAKDKAKNREGKVSFSIVSNLTTDLEDETLSKLEEWNVNISTSLDGPKEIHNSNRKSTDGNAHDKVIKNIKKLGKRGIEVRALCTVTSKSFGSGEEIVDEYLNLGLDKIWLRPLNKLGYAEEMWDEIGYTAEEFGSFYSKTLDYILDDKNGKIKELTAFLLSKKILSVPDPEMTELTSPCGAGISQLLYDNKGNIYTCDEGKVFDEFKLGNVKESSPKDIFTNDTIVSMIDISSRKGYLCGDCVWDPFCAICPVNTYSEQGNILSKLSQDFRCAINSHLLQDIFKRLIYKKEERQILKEWAKVNE